MSISQEGFLPSQYRSKQEFLASLPPWRRLLAKLNWHPTIDKKVARYAIEQRLLQLEKETEQLENENRRLARENAREAELNARIAALWPSSKPSSTPMPPAADDSPT